MNTNLTFSSLPRFLLRGLLLVTSALTYADSATSSTPPSSAAPSNSGSLTVKQHLIKWMLTDQKFIEKAALSSRAEIELSQLALEKGQASGVRGFAKTMVHDHTAADTELSVIAVGKNLKVPDQLDSDHEDDVSRLKSLNDTQFDAAYIDIMRRDHENAVSLFAAAANDEKLSPELRQFAQKTLPTLRAHAEHVRALVPESAALAP